MSQSMKPSERDIQVIERGGQAGAPTIAINPMASLIDQLDKAFPVPSIKPGSTMNELQYAAGCRAVVDWVKVKQQRGKV
ncbi:hypothetical protein D3C80_1710160 [compost metagenome]